MSEQVSVCSVKEAASLMRVSTATIRRLVDAGKLPAYRIGRSVRVDKTALLAKCKLSGAGVTHGQ